MIHISSFFMQIHDFYRCMPGKSGTPQGSLAEIQRLPPPAYSSRHSAAPPRYYPQPPPPPPPPPLLLLACPPEMTMTYSGSSSLHQRCALDICIQITICNTKLIIFTTKSNNFHTEFINFNGYRVKASTGASGIFRRESCFIIKSTFFNRKSGFLIRKSGFFTGKSGFFS